MNLNFPPILNATKNVQILTLHKNVNSEISSQSFISFQVTEIEGRSALLKWGPPVRDTGDGGAKFEPLDHITDMRYEVCLSDKGKDGKYRTIFKTSSIECRLTDLRPNTEYHIRIHAMTDTQRGGASDTVSFFTKCCEPDKCAPPKLVSRSKTSLRYDF